MAGEVDGSGRRKSTRPQVRLSTLFVGMLAGVLIGATAITAQGSDLRPDRTSDVAQLVAEAEARNQELSQRAADLRAETDRLTAAQGAAPASSDPGQELASRTAGLAAVKGPAVRVTLTDAPVDVTPPGVSGDLLVVHEQDIQNVVNALWTAGAEAMTIQGQRVVSTTAVKCVGNTVVLHGVPYAPPYVIEAIGDADSLLAAINDSPSIQVYKQYVAAYGLGYAVDRVGEIEAPAFAGSVGLRFATSGQ